MSTTGAKGESMSEPLYEEIDPDDGVNLRVISLGAGVQSSALYRMAARGMFGVVPSDAIFADTKNEPAHVYRQLDELERAHGDVIKIHRVSAGDLMEDYFSGATSKKDPSKKVVGAVLPFFLLNEDGSKGFANRTCTGRYKVEPILKCVRKLLGLKPGQAAGGKRAEQWIGISLDEPQRMRTSPNNWTVNRYPLVMDRPWRRGEILRWFRQEGLPEPKRSSCLGCPFHSDAEWRAIKANPEQWAWVTNFDRRTREEKRFLSDASSPTALLRGIPFLHASRKPLTEINFDQPDTGQLDLFQGECAGVCGV